MIIFSEKMIILFYWVTFVNGLKNPMHLNSKFSRRFLAKKMTDSSQHIISLSDVSEKDSTMPKFFDSFGAIHCKIVW